MSDNHILIIGASSAIGCEIIRQIAEDSTVIIAHYNSGKQRLDELSREVKGQIVPIQADLESEEGIVALIEAVSSLCDSPGKIVFLAAPRLTMVRFKDLTWPDFKYSADMQLQTAVMLLGRFLPRMAKVEFGRVVFMLSSVTLGVPPANMTHYVAAKYALLGMMKALASEYANRRITVNAVSPSMVETDFLRDIPGKIVELAAQQHPLKRNATPADIAPVVKMLLSDAAGYLTGANIPITGGTQF
jgi:3-oxoacyl-[acyl-carrier protein] reductase